MSKRISPDDRSRQRLAGARRRAARRQRAAEPRARPGGSGRSRAVPSSPAAHRLRAAQRRARGQARGRGSRATGLPGSPVRSRSHTQHRRRGTTRSWRSRGSEIRRRARRFALRPPLRRGRRGLGRAPPSTAPARQAGAPRRRPLRHRGCPGRPAPVRRGGRRNHASRNAPRCRARRGARPAPVPPGSCRSRRRPDCRRTPLGPAGNRGGQESTATGPPPPSPSRPAIAAPRAVLEAAPKRQGPRGSSSHPTR